MTAGRAIDQLVAQGIPLPSDPDTIVVPEPVVKQWLESRGLVVPRSHDTIGPERHVAVKAFGPGIVHKSELGAVAVDVVPEAIEEAKATITGALRSHGLAPAGFLVEEMADPGVEVVVGVVDHPVFGLTMAVGLGGVLTELLDDVSTRVLPVDRSGAATMIDQLRGAALLDEFRGRRVDRSALVETMVSLAEAAQRLGPRLAELECNPVIVGGHGAVIVDARLILRRSPPDTDASESGGETTAVGEMPVVGEGPVVRTDFTRLFEPRGVAVVGASATKPGLAGWALDAMRQYGRTNLAAVHPTASEIGGVPAYPTVDDIPFPVDYVTVAVPAAACPSVVAACGRAEFVHVISGGFREVGNEALEEAVVDAARAAGVRVLGPNCIGLFSPRGRITFQTHNPASAGRIGVVSQSGGLAGDIVSLGAATGMNFSAVVSLGNAADVTPAELVEWLVDDPGTSVVGLYLEDPRDGARFVRALRRAAGVVPVVLLIGGLSPQGEQAALSHTGALAGGRRTWQGIADSTGSTLAGSLNELVTTLRYLERYLDEPPGIGPSSVLVIGVGGGATALAADACDQAGLEITRLDDAVQDRLRDRGYGVGTSLTNPIEIPIGPAVDPEILAGVVDDVVTAQPYTDVLVHLNVRAYVASAGGGVGRLAPTIAALAEVKGGRIALALRNLETATPEVQADVQQVCLDHRLAWFTRMEDAAAAIGATQRFDIARHRQP